MRPPVRNRTVRSGVAVCITGMQRSLLEQPVLHTYHAYVIRPLATAGWDVATHLAIALPQGHAPVGTIDREIRARFGARSVSLIPEGHAEGWCRYNTSAHCRISDTPRTFERHGDLSVLVQWYAVDICYTRVEEDERARGRPYDWLMRLRTDMVYFADTPLVADHPLDTRWVYVASGGMTSQPAYRCMNDQFILCPRGLCRSYFKLLELWESPFCNATGSSTSIFTSSSGMVAGPPVAPFLLPSPPIIDGKRGSAQWYMFARFGVRDGAPCTADDETDQCCGLIREVAWPYTIARYQRRTLECQERLTAWHAIHLRATDFLKRPSFYPNRSAYVRQCLQVENEWRNASPGWRLAVHHPQTRVLSS